MSDRAAQGRCMKTYSTRYRRPTLLPVPYSARPDRLERGIRMLRALRLITRRATGAGSRAPMRIQVRRHPAAPERPEKVLRGEIVLTTLWRWGVAVDAPPRAPMNVTGTIEAILNQKTGEVWSIAPDATVYDAVSLMAEKNVGALLVVENGRLVGIISERDYTRKVMLRGKRSRETQVREIMSTQLTTVAAKRERR